MSEHECNEVEAVRGSEEVDSGWILVLCTCIECGREYRISERMDKAVIWGEGDGSCLTGDDEE